MSVRRPLFIIAPSIEAHPLDMLIATKERAGLDICFVKAPGFGAQRSDFLMDLCYYTGARAVGIKHDNPLEKIDLEELGEAESIIVTKDHAIIKGGFGAEESVKERAKSIRAQIDLAEQEFERKDLEKRAAALSHGVAVIKVGAYTQVEMTEKLDRVDDALRACMSALDEGVVLGGARTWMIAQDWLDTDDVSDSFGYHAVFMASLAVAETLLQNANVPDDRIFEIIEKCIENEVVYDIHAMKFRDDAKILEPVKVCRVALEAAASVAKSVLTTNACINIIPGQKSQMPF
jgi:chaperonin GroEL